MVWEWNHSMTSNLRIKRNSQTLITNSSANNNITRETNNTMNLDMCGYLTEDYSFLCYPVILEEKFVTSSTQKSVSSQNWTPCSPWKIFGYVSHFHLSSRCWYVIKYPVSRFIHPKDRWKKNHPVIAAMVWKHFSTIVPYRLEPSLLSFGNRFPLNISLPGVILMPHFQVSNVVRR